MDGQWFVKPSSITPAFLFCFFLWLNSFNDGQLVPLLQDLLSRGTCQLGFFLFILTANGQQQKLRFRIRDADVVVRTQKTRTVFFYSESIQKNIFKIY